MKSDGIKRSVRAQRYDRAAGDAPSIGKVSRMPGTGLPKGERRRKTASEGGRNNRVRQGRRVVVIIWMVLLVIAASAVLGVAVWFGMSRKQDTWLVQRPVAQVMEPAEDESDSDIPSLSKDAAIARVKEAVAIRDPGKIPAFFRMGSTSPQTVVDFLAAIPKVDGETTGYSHLGDLFLNGLNVSGVLANYRLDGKKRNRVVFMTLDPAGNWQIDFEAFARTVTPSWDAILGDAPGPATVRVYAARDNYYNGVFKNEARWICYGLASPDTPDLLMSYCEKGSAQAAAMEYLFPQGRGMARVTLEISRVPDGDSRQFQITKVLATDWLVGEKPFDERFK